MTDLGDTKQLLSSLVEKAPNENISSPPTRNEPIFLSVALWRRKLALGASVLVFTAGLSAQPAMAANEAIYFGGTISQNAFCRIFVRREGTLAARADNLELSSSLPGGQSGIADVWSIPAYDVTAETVPYFVNSAPSGGNTGISTNVTFSGTSLFNGINFGPQNGSTPVTLNAGFSATRLNVDLSITRPTPFPAGNYSTVVTVRCE